VRFVVDLHPVEDRVEGTLASDGRGEPCPFSGWLELLRLLEAHLLPAAVRQPPLPLDH
jgi:hypothetical protein